METSIAEQPPLRAATVRHIGPYQEIGEAFARLEAAARTSGLMEKDPLLVGIYYDDPKSTPSAQLRSDAGIIAGLGAHIAAPMVEAMIPAGRYLKGRHTGPYEGLPAAWASLLDEGVRQAGLTRRDGVSYELYLNNPMNAAAADLITEIYIPVV